MEPNEFFAVKPLKREFHVVKRVISNSDCVCVCAYTMMVVCPEGERHIGVCGIVWRWIMGWYGHDHSCDSRSKEVSQRYSCFLDGGQGNAREGKSYVSLSFSFHL